MSKALRLTYERRLLPQAYWNHFHACLSEFIAILFQRMCTLSIVLKIWHEHKSSVPSGCGSVDICCSCFGLQDPFWSQQRQEQCAITTFSPHLLSSCFSGGMTKSGADSSPPRAPLLSEQRPRRTRREAPHELAAGTVCLPAAGH